MNARLTGLALLFRQQKEVRPCKAPGCRNPAGWNVDDLCPWHLAATKHRPAGRGRAQPPRKPPLAGYRLGGGLDSHDRAEIARRAEIVRSRATASARLIVLPAACPRCGRAADNTLDARAACAVLVLGFRVRKRGKGADVAA